MPGMLGQGADETLGMGMVPGISREKMIRAIKELKRQGVPLTRENIAEMAAMLPDMPEDQAQPEMGRGYFGQRIADPNSAEGKAEAKQKRKLQEGPPASMTRGRGMLSR